MGLSASQARFLQLTARKNDIEYEAQQITQQRLALSQQLATVSNEYNDAISNKKLVFSYADSTVHQVDVSYANYKNYMNQQQEGLTSSQQQIFLVSTSGKIVVNSISDMEDIIEKNTTYVKVADADENTDYSDYSVVSKTNDDGVEEQYYAKQKFDTSNFVIVAKDEVAREEMIQNSQYKDSDETSDIRKNFIFGDDLNDVDSFQNAIKDGIYSFATISTAADTEGQLIPQNWSTIASGALTEKLDESDDAEAEAKYEKVSKELELTDKKLQMTMDELETKRDAIKTEMDSVEKVINDNIEKSFDTFS